MNLKSAGFIASLLLLPASYYGIRALSSFPSPDQAGPAYQVESVQLPSEMVPEISGVTFAPSGKLVISNRHGEIWFGNPDGTGWRRFASGLHEPLGLLVESDSTLYVTQRPELTRVSDTDGDGWADRFETVADDWGVTDNYHEFAYGLKRDADGFFLGGLGLDSGVGEIDRSRGPLKKERVLREQHRSLVRYRGWVFKVSPNGEFIPWAMGFRQPCGIGRSPDGEFFITENQGDWIPSSSLIHVQKDHFYGHPGSLKWAPERLPEGPLTAEKLAALRSPPAVFLPHGPMGGSPGEPVWDTTGGKFGPFKSQVFVGDFSKLVSRICLEKVGGDYQGACFPFLTEQEIGQGNMRMAFGPDGSLYVGQTTRGWAKGDGLQRVIWNGVTPAEILSMILTPSGFRLTFTAAMTGLESPEKFRVTRFRYYYHSEYGSRQIDFAPVSVFATRPAPDGRSVELLLRDLAPGFIYQLEAPELHSRSGVRLLHPTGFYTVNRILSGKFGSIIQPSDAVGWGGTRGAKANLRIGQRVYRQHCVACHQAGGRGVPGLRIPDFNSVGGPLRMSDELLLASISRGTEEKGMPPFGGILSAQELVSVIAYLRTNFGSRSNSTSSSPKLN